MGGRPLLWEVGMRMRKWFIYFLIAVLVLCFMACKGTERIVEVPTVKTEYKEKGVEKRDSIYVKDSTFVYGGGDTVYMYKYKNIYRDMIKTDTLYITKRDSVAVPYPVEKKLSYWEENLLCFGKLFVVFILLAVVVAIGYFVWHRIRSRTW